jgi:hypothetical protein
MFPFQTRNGRRTEFLMGNRETEMKGFRFGSPQGSFYILPGQEGWEATFGNDSLGAFTSPQHAAHGLARGLTSPHLTEVDTSTLEIPEKIDEWEIVHV